MNERPRRPVIELNTIQAAGGRAWPRRLGAAGAGASFAAVLALGVLGCRSHWVREHFGYERTSTIPELAAGKLTLDEEGIALRSASGLIAWFWHRTVTPGFTPGTLQFRQGSLNQSRFWRDRMPDSTFLFPDQPEVGTLKTFRWVRGEWARVLPGWRTSHSVCRFAVPYWVVMLPFTIPPIWWLWCPRGRAWPRLTLRRLGLTIVAFAAALAGLAELRRASTLDRAVAAIEGVGGSLEYARDRPRSPSSAYWVRLDNEWITDAKLARVRWAIASLPNVRKLSLSCSQVTDSGLGAIQGLDRLRSLELGTMRVTDAGLRNLPLLPDLRDVDLFYCRGIRGPGLAHLARLPELRSLRLAYTGINDAALDHLRRSSRLESVDVSRTDVTDAAADALERFLSERQRLRRDRSR